MNPYIALFAVAFLGGLIAYLADRLGRVLGKKRLSLLGMRPRHTAEFLTVCAGVFIPIVTFLIVLALSAPVRQWLLESAQILKDRDDSERGLQKSQRDLKQKQAELQIKESQIRDKDSQVRVETSQLRDLKAEFDDRGHQITNETAQLARAKGEYEKLNGQLTSAKNAVDSAKQAKAKAEQVVATLSTTRDKLLANNSGLQGKNLELEGQANATNSKLVTVNSQLGAADQQLASKTKDLADAQTHLSDTQGKLDAAQSNLNQLQSRLSQLQSAIAEAMRQYGALGNFTNEGRYTPIDFGINQELARITVPAGIGVSEARDLLNALITQASNSALERGAKPVTANGHAAGLIELPDESGNRIPVEELETRLVNQMANKPFTQMAIAKAYYNTTVGEQVPLDVSIYNDPLAYRKNQVLAETSIHGDLTYTQILDEISSFVHDKVQLRARRDKMIPVAGQEAGLGQVSSADVIDLVVRIHTWGRAVTLIAEAKEDTRVGDPLQLKFELR